MSLINLVVVAINAWVSWRHRQRAYDELVALDDRLLADIGLGRTDIPAIFYERVRRESVCAGGGAMALSALQAKRAFGHRGLPPTRPGVVSTPTHSSSDGGMYGFDPRRS